MFSVGSYTSTYTGPFEASGETLRRGRGDALAAGAAAGQRRAYMAPGRGVGAGSGAMRYRAGLEADSKAAQGYGAAQQSLLANLMGNADSRLMYQNNQADELNLLRALQMQRDTSDQNFGLQLRGDQYEALLNQAKLRTERDVGRGQNFTDMFTIGLGVA
jgi:hypothetical protein